MIHCKQVNKHIDFTKYIFKHHVYTQSLRNDCLLELSWSSRVTTGDDIITLTQSVEPISLCIYYHLKTICEQICKVGHLKVFSID